MQDAGDGDTTISIETLIEAAEQVEAVRPDGEGLDLWDLKSGARI